MSELSGNLADFALPAVIRLLAAGSKTGILVVQGTHLDGSVFFDDGELTYATTRKNSVITPEPSQERRAQDSPEHDTMIADVATRLTRQGGGTFSFQAGVFPVHTVETSYSVDHVLKMVDMQLEMWLDIDVALGSTDQPYTMTGDLPIDEKIELTGQQWNVLAALGPGQSASDIAARMILSELTTAEILVMLKEDGLVEAAELSTVRSPATGGHSADGDRLIEPMEPDIVVRLTDAVQQADEEEVEMEAPVSELAARWRNLRTGSRDEVPQSR